MRLTRNQLVATSLAVAVVTWLFFGIWQLRSSVTALEEGQLQVARAHAEQAYLTTRPLQVATINLQPDVRALVTYQQLVSQTATLQEQFPVLINAFSEGVNDESPGELWERVETVNQSMSQLAVSLRHSWVLRFVVPMDQVNRIAQLSSDAAEVARYFNQGPRTFIVLLQNTHEIRATGGFAGSFARITLSPTAAPVVAIEDIYTPDGQFEGYLEPPAGVAEYLSAGNGLRLPDANWDPHFPNSAQQVLRFFAHGQVSKVDGVVAINLPVIEEMLQVIGPLYIPDYDQVVTPENMAELARADRDEFFPGSQEKAAFLNALFKTVRYAMSTLSPAQQKELVSILLEATQTKDIQFFSTDQSVQSILERYQLAGTMHNQSPLYVSVVESNVGINKANKLISRRVMIDVSDTQTIVRVTFTNDNVLQPNDSVQPHYANYFRLYTLPNMQLTHVTYDGQERRATSAQVAPSPDQLFTEHGLLLDVPVQQTRSAEFVLEHPSLGKEPTLYLQHQSGLGPTVYTITYQGQIQTLEITRDTVIQL